MEKKRNIGRCRPKVGLEWNPSSWNVYFVCFCVVSAAITLSNMSSVARTFFKNARFSKTENVTSSLFLACGWYGALGRVVNFAMCHLRSLGRVANFKNEAFRNWGIRFDFFASLTCCTCCRMIIRGVGVGGCTNVLDDHFSDVTEHVHVAHAVVWSSGGWVWGGCINVLDEHFSDVREHVHVAHAVLWSSDFPYVTQHVHLAHAVVWSSWGGVLTFLTSSALTLRNMSPLLKWRPVSMLHKKNQKVHKKKGHLGLQPDMAW